MASNYRPIISSVNGAIDPSLCSLKYVAVDQVAKKAIQLGKASLIAKIDIKSTYRLIPVSPCDWHYLGMQWNGQIYVDGMLPFGLRSTPKIFNAVADALNGVRLDKVYKTFTITWTILPLLVLQIQNSAVGTYTPYRQSAVT